MQRNLAALTILLLIGTVVSRAVMMKRRGIEVMHFGKLDKTDYFIPPFVLFYFYTIFAAAFNFPILSKQVFFQSESIAWAGLIFCLGGLLILIWSIISFGDSFRVGIDTGQPAELITIGVFTISRNPIYVGFWFFMLGQFLVFPNWILLIYIGAATWLFHRQVLREEEFLMDHFGEEFTAYCKQVRRYL